MIRRSIFCLVFLLTSFWLPCAAQNSAGKEKSSSAKEADSSAAKSGTIEDRVEKYLRNLYAWGPAFTIKVGPSKPSPIPDLLELPVTVSMGTQSDTAAVYASKTGNFLIRGELADMAVDPFAEVRSKLRVGTSPTLGPADAKVTLFEFADFECPSCRQLDLVLRDLLPRHPEVRLVFKHYPLTEIHPWAMTAAIASQCAFQQNPAAFWKIHHAIFDAQEVISASNVWDKMLELGTEVGLDKDVYRSCMSNPETADQVKENIEQGRTLAITATPTTFVDGRRVVGPERSTIEQYVEFTNLQ
jgi:protein-disulfide isomerase